MKRIYQAIATLLWSFSFSASAAFLPPAQGAGGMVVTEQHLATQVGADILKAGGNAIDAAVAVGYALAVVDPNDGNIGGGGFMLIHLANKQNKVIDFRETAPAAITPQLFFNKPGHLKKGSPDTMLFTGVPGTVLGLNTALQRFGSMPLAKVMQPAIRLAENGFILSRYQVAMFNHYTPIFQRHPNTEKIFLPQGKRVTMGQRFYQKELAHTLKAISQQGSQVFYRGYIAKAIVRASHQQGGVLSLKDFAHYKVKIRQPLVCRYRDLTIVTAPPPSSGVTICEILAIVSHYPLAQLGFHSASAVHYNVEAMRYAFADRNRYLGDPAFVKNPVKKLLSAEYIKSLVKKIKRDHAGDSRHLQQQSRWQRPHMHTTHFVIADRQGNVVSVTYTLNSYFGNKLMAGSTGFFLNNELDDFALQLNLPNQFRLVQGKANLIAPNKRPLSSMSPSLVMKDQQVDMAVGAAGGSTIITTIVQIIENVFDYHMTINAAVNQARYHMQWLPDVIYYEPFALSANTLQRLKLMGYAVRLGFFNHVKYWGQAAALLFNPTRSICTGANDNRAPDGKAEGLKLSS